MPTIRLNAKESKPVFSGHETFPLRHGWLKKAYDTTAYQRETSASAKDIFHKETAIATFGVGKNMVSSIWYWAKHTGVFDENGSPTEFSRLLLDSDNGYDPWLESPISLWLIHWNLVRNETLLTFHWYFNCFNAATFDRNHLLKQLIQVCVQNQINPPSNTTLKRDIDCLLRTYVSKPPNSEKLSEETLESPLSELNLIINSNNRGNFQARRGAKLSLTEGVFLLALTDFWAKRWRSQSTVSLESMVYDRFSPGRIFLLDEEAVLEKAYALDRRGVGLEWSESAGLRQFYRSTELEKLKLTAIELIKKEYTENR